MRGRAAHPESKAKKGQSQGFESNLSTGVRRNTVKVCKLHIQWATLSVCRPGAGVQGEQVRVEAFFTPAAIPREHLSYT